MLSTVGRFFYTKYWKIFSVEHCGKIYLHKILGNTFCWTLSEDLFTQNTGKYFMLKTVGRFTYTKYWEILYVDYCWKIYLQNKQRNTWCWTLGIIINTKYWDVLSIEHCGKVYLPKMLGNTFYLHKIPGNTEKYLMLNTVGRFIYT
jgi:hypothetical protein